MQTSDLTFLLGEHLFALPSLLFPLFCSYLADPQPQLCRTAPLPSNALILLTLMVHVDYRAEGLCRHPNRGSVVLQERKARLQTLEPG